MVTALRVLICVLSIILLCLLGVIGECLLNIPYTKMFPGGLQALVESGPPCTRFVFSMFPLNGGVVVLSVTPFTILLFGLALLCIVSDAVARLFWYLFVAIWLLAGIYLSICAIGLLGAYVILLRTMPFVTALSIAVQVIDVVLILALVVVVILAIRKNFKERQPNPPPSQP